MKLAKSIFEQNLQKYLPDVWKELHSTEAKDARKLISKGKIIDKPAISYRQKRYETPGVSGVIVKTTDDGIFSRIYVGLPFTPVTNEELFLKMILLDVKYIATCRGDKKAIKKMEKDHSFLTNVENIRQEANKEYNKTMGHISNRKADQFDHIYIFKKDDKVHTYLPADIPSELRFIDYLKENKIKYQTRLVKRFIRAEMQPNKFIDNSWKYREYDTVEALNNIINKYNVTDETIKERCQKILKKNIEAHIKFEAAKKAELEAVATKKRNGNKFANTAK